MAQGETDAERERAIKLLVDEAPLLTRAQLDRLRVVFCTRPHGAERFTGPAAE